MGSSDEMNALTLECVRKSLIRQEDTIIFTLIERSKYPINSPLYHHNLFNVPGFSASLFQYIVKQTEAIHSQVLHPAAAAININKTIWDLYFNQLLPLFVAEGDDGNYAPTATSDLECLQAISRRIHYGKFVAEVKFKDAPQDYEPAIRAQDRDALMKLLTFESVEEMVKRRVEKKARVFAQEVCLSNNDEKKVNYKIDPSVLPHMYEEWIMPLTKLVEVEYLLRRLD